MYSGLFLFPSSNTTVTTFPFSGILKLFPFTSFQAVAQGRSSTDISYLSFLSFSSNTSSTLILHLPSLLGSLLSSTVPIYVLLAPTPSILFFVKSFALIGYILINPILDGTQIVESFIGLYQECLPKLRTFCCLLESSILSRI